MAFCRSTLGRVGARVRSRQCTRLRGLAVFSVGDSVPNVHSTAWVADNAAVIGNVHLKEDSSVWFGATVRGDNDLITIGSRTNIQDGSVLHSDHGVPLTIGDDGTWALLTRWGFVTTVALAQSVIAIRQDGKSCCTFLVFNSCRCCGCVLSAAVTVGHMVMLHGCTIGNGSLIGIGSVLLNKCRIGKNCIIGANSLIPEGKVIPDNSLVMGSPGKVVRELSADVQEQLLVSARHYVDNAKKFRSSLRRLPDA
jgi:carbonic anhydrase/acetyltransferase-like protein (isoleucine patch superfamily)